MEPTIGDHDFAIRRFCPARMELEQNDDEEAMIMSEFELLSPSTQELDQLVNSFMKNDDDDDDHDEILTFSMLEDVFLDDELDLRNGSIEKIEKNEKFGSIVVSPNVEVVSHGVNQGLDLVHLLLACAEALGCRDTQLANSLLDQVWGLTNPWGDSLQRVSYCFAIGLKSRLSLLHNKFLFGSDSSFRDAGNVSAEEKIEAFHLLYQTTPYIAFGYMVANEAICEASRGKDSIHVIDLGMTNTLQWPSLIRTLSSRPEGPPRVRITGLLSLSPNENLLQIESSMKNLVEYAKSLGVSLHFNMVSEPVTPSLLTKETLGLKEGEEVFFNSVMRLHNFVNESRGSLKAILQSIKKLNPTLLTVIEQDANHNGPFFLGRFLESLHYYSAIFDSLEASLPRESHERVKIEKHHFAEEIRNIVGNEGSSRIERHERADQWRRQLGRAGFQVMPLKCMSQVRLMLSVYGCDGYTLTSEKGCLHLGWKGRPIMLASAWQPNLTSPRL
ncbi:GRAS family protein RAD1-like [Euphorbia lathyris]|uniref:GRAS family protein RAD1-like n=1 Tax=Euphorbia lathyris TaxID=212925 RepID=UPI00331345A4